MPIEKRFWLHVNKDGPIPQHRPDLGQCWLWSSSTLRHYGHFLVNGKMMPAHRYSFFLAYGYFPTEYPRNIIDHLCRIPACIRPTHLEAVSSSTNTQRAKDFYYNRKK